MLARTITSLQHPIVKYCVKLRSERSFRHSEGKVLVCGSKLVTELASEIPIKTLLTSSPKSPVLQAEETLLVSDEVMKKISGLAAPEPLAAIVELPKEASLTGCPALLILDGISDPGNLGTLIRTALALGWEGIFLLGRCCDPYNDKALRAAKGATFRIPLQTGSWDSLQSLLSSQSYHKYVADLHGTCFAQIEGKAPLALALGSESHGPSAEIKKNFSALSIPMSGKMESLNVAIAGAILLQHLRGRV